MRKRRELVILLREAVARKLETERVYTSRFAEEVIAANRETVADLQFALALEQVKSIIRDLCKEAAETETTPLFPELGDELPKAIAVPRTTRDEPYYVALRNATGGELLAAIGLMDRQVAAVIRRRDNLFGLHERFEARGGRDGDKLLDVLVVRVPEPA